MNYDDFYLVGAEWIEEDKDSDKEVLSRAPVQAS